jgi:O-succinylbenzoic acid--CoA ligase
MLHASLGQPGDLGDCFGAVAEARDAVVVEENEPARFCAAFAEAVAAGGTVFLANPAWGVAERAQFNALVATGAQRPTSNIEHPTTENLISDQSRIQNLKSKMVSGWLCIPTGGSAGKLKLARHDEGTLHAAVRGFAEHFGVARVNAVGVLPLHHVGGLMGWLRCALTGGEFVACDWKELEAGFAGTAADAEHFLEKMKIGLARRAGGDWFLSLVPTQLHRMLAWPAAVEWLRGFRAVLVGGGAAWPELAEAGARAGLPLAFTYGATETAAAVMALRPEEFLAGGSGCGTALPHARVTTHGAGAIAVEGESVFRGYWPEWREPGAWLTDDEGFFDERGSLRVRGRRDAVIITGGEKVEPSEVEAALRATGEFADVAVVGVPDAEWGSVVVACYPAGGREPDLARVKATLASRLARPKWPKQFVALTDWQRDYAGKIDRTRLLTVVLTRVDPRSERGR